MGDAGRGRQAREDFAAAARRELAEETGIAADPGAEISRRDARFTTSDGAVVVADERFFLVRVATTALSDAGWSAAERAGIVDQRWWTVAELRAATDTVWPADLWVLLDGIGSG